MIYLELEDALHVARRTLEANPEIRDLGLLESAVARPRASAFGEDAYRTLHEKAAALLHSLARNHPLIDGNKRLAFAATFAFLGLNRVRLTFSNDAAYHFVIEVATGRLDDVPAIADVLRANSAASRRSPDRRRLGPGARHVTLRVATQV
jgi:death on curing protein